jgi:act minimal PKS acyl carrier protein
MPFTTKDLQRILESSSGVAEGVDWEDPATMNKPFTELGYDSLALLELAARVQQEYGVHMPDDSVVLMTDPAAALDYLNQRLAQG